MLSEARTIARELIREVKAVRDRAELFRLASNGTLPSNNSAYIQGAADVGDGLTSILGAAELLHDVIVDTMRRDAGQVGRQA